ncbi:MAG TPA: hypothetical protein VFE51_11480 [Verrucomicrobiae bacterium]|nr:hypothetical protein [Verrucomicrobiae bacterium]
MNASIYARKSDPPRLLFTFRRTASRSGSIIHVLREYFYPDGRTAARERVVYEGNSLKSYELEELQTGSSGTVSVSDDPRDRGHLQVTFEYSKDSSHRGHKRVVTEPANSEPLVNDMMGAFLSANYDAIARGIKVSCRYIVVSRKEIVGLSFSKQGETTYHNREALILKLQPTNPLISVLVDPLYFIVEKAPPHRVLEYTGRTTPKINEGNRWKDLDALTVFDW